MTEKIICICPSCHYKSDVDAQYLGKIARCPKCKTKFKIDAIEGSRDKAKKKITISQVKKKYGNIPSERAKTKAISPKSSDSLKKHVLTAIAVMVIGFVVLFTISIRKMDQDIGTKKSITVLDVESLDIPKHKDNIMAEDGVERSKPEVEVKKKSRLRPPSEITVDDKMDHQGAAHSLLSESLPKKRESYDVSIFHEKEDVQKQMDIMSSEEKTVSTEDDQNNDDEDEPQKNQQKKSAAGDLDPISPQSPEYGGPGGEHHPPEMISVVDDTPQGKKDNITATVDAHDVVFPQHHSNFLSKYCFDCHNNDVQKGKVNLEALPHKITNLQAADLWQKVLNVMNSGEMPPAKKTQPKGEEKANFLYDLAQTMVQARKALAQTGGKITMRRLNRREYVHSIKELLGVELEINTHEESTSRFDTAGSSLFMSSDQLQKYMSHAERALKVFFIDFRHANESKKIFRLEPEKELNQRSQKSLQRLKKNMDEHLRWEKQYKKVLALRANRDVIQKYDFNVEKNIIQFSKHLSECPDPKDYGFNTMVSMFKSYNDALKYYPFYLKYSKLPFARKGVHLKVYQNSTRIDIKVPWKMVPGKYIMRIRGGVTDDSAEYRHFVQIGHPQLDGAKRGFSDLPIKTVQVLGRVSSPQVIETEVHVLSEKTNTFSIQERQATDSKEFEKVFFRRFMNENGYGTPPAVWIDWVEIEGPFRDIKKRSVLFQILSKYMRYGSESSRARNIIKDFAKEAFRGQTFKSQYSDTLLTLFKNERKKGKSFDESIQKPLSIVLASPMFLYFYEKSQQDKKIEISDLELASRLSFFLWSSPPDRTLRELADKKRLKDSKTLSDQVDRMIHDPRFEHFAAGFMDQWLDMERLDLFQFDVRTHLEFDESARAAARQEVYESFLYLIRSDKRKKLRSLLKSDHVVVNSLMATHYGLKNVKSDDFVKVDLPKASPRGGLLGMSAFHAMGSDGTSRSVVERGAWVLRHIFNDPPPPAPANVPQISRLDHLKLSSRERLHAHQSDPQCASCHSRIDPIGYGFENFTAAGKWQVSETIGQGRRSQVVPIDASGSLGNEGSFEGFFEMRDQVVDRIDDFARGFTEALIAYSLGRDYELTDDLLAKEIMDSAEQSDYALPEFFKTLVASQVFRTK